MTTVEVTETTFEVIEAHEQGERRAAQTGGA